MGTLQLAPTTAALSTAAPTTGTSGLTAVPIAVTTIPAALENLMRVIQTNATPVALSEGNTLTLATALGNITVTVSSQLGAAEKQSLTQELIDLVQTQRPVTLTVHPGSPPTQGSLLIAPLAAQETVQNVQTPTFAPSLSAPPLAIGDTLSAIVLSAPQASVAVPPAMAPSVTTGLPTTPDFVLSAPKAKSDAAPLMSAIPSAPSTDSKVTPQTPVLAPSFSPEILALLKQGNEVALHVSSVVQSGYAEQSLPPHLEPNQIMATVSGTGTEGQLILKAGDATLFVKTPASAPVGTAVIVSVDAVKSAPLLPLPALDAPSNFQALPQALAALAQINPQTLHQMLATHIPQPTEALSGALLFLFGAFKQGNVRGWLGNEATDRLTNAGKSWIIDSLSKELGGAGQLAQDSVVGAWRSYPLPLYAQQQFQALTLYVHSDREARKERANGASGIGRIRFLIDMRLSKLGAMQVDGFVQQKKLDMILRSETTMPEGLHHELRAAYIKALEAVGYTGALNFQVGRKFWIVMNQPAPQGIVT